MGATSLGAHQAPLARCLHSRKGDTEVLRGDSCTGFYYCAGAQVSVCANCQAGSYMQTKIDLAVGPQPALHIR